MFWSRYLVGLNSIGPYRSKLNILLRPFLSIFPIITFMGNKGTAQVGYRSVHGFIFAPLFTFHIDQQTKSNLLLPYLGRTSRQSSKKWHIFTKIAKIRKSDVTVTKSTYRDVTLFFCNPLMVILIKIAMKQNKHKSPGRPQLTADAAVEGIVQQLFRDLSLVIVN